MLWGETVLQPGELKLAEVSTASSWSVTPAGFEMKEASFAVWVEYSDPIPLNTHLGENARREEVSDDETTSIVLP
ncbi:hypothetical protein MB84_28990 (plasmid) [Pandoraea oxalativorans]|uniref:Uncharacterized protein n=1 Tax=Pandoraea oxalativorans TaxID=573737 RepID=A0A0G3II83_9BURK|nr:hypothetical protein MB84_28990 [Pandoraea oxalativorans]